MIDCITKHKSNTYEEIPDYSLNPLPINYTLQYIIGVELNKMCEKTTHRQNGNRKHLVVEIK